MVRKRAQFKTHLCLDQLQTGYHLAGKNNASKVKQYLDILEQQPESEDALYYLGEFYQYTLNDNAKGLQYFQKLAALNPDYDLLNYNIGSSYYNLQDYQKAVDAYLESQKYQPENEDAYYNAGYSYLYFLGNYDAAIEQFELLLKVNPKSADAMYNIGLAYQEKQQYKQAVKWLDKSVQQQPSFRQSLLDDYGYLYLRLKKEKEALEYFNENVVQYPLDPWSYYHLACYYSITEDTAKGLEFLEKALQKGFNEFEHLATDSDLENLRSNKDYNGLVSKFASPE
jgi:tetratricopeptide (TPR) repeat protein